MTVDFDKPAPYLPHAAEVEREDAERLLVDLHDYKEHDNVELEDSCDPEARLRSAELAKDFDALDTAIEVIIRRNPDLSWPEMLSTCWH